MRRELNAQLVAALEPPSAQNGPAVGCGRAGTKAMDASAAALFGLICSFDHFSITCRADYMFSEFRKSRDGNDVQDDCKVHPVILSEAGNPVPNAETLQFAQGAGQSHLDDPVTLATCQVRQPIPSITVEGPGRFNSLPLPEPVSTRRNGAKWQILAEKTRLFRPALRKKRNNVVGIPNAVSHAQGLRREFEKAAVNHFPVSDMTSPVL